MAPASPAYERAKTFVAEPASSRHARHFVTGWLQERDCDDYVNRVGLAVSELAANAVLHTAQPFTVSMDPQGDGVRVEVVDSAPHRRPVPMPAAGNALDITQFSETGRGLQIVSSLANRWGVVLDPNVKTVWCEFDADEPPAAVEPGFVDNRPPEPPPPDVHHMRFLGLPVRAAIASGLDVEDACRDVQWLPPDQRSDDAVELLDLVERSASVRLAGRHAALHASSQDRKQFDLDVSVTDEALLAMGLLNQALAQRATSSGRRGPTDEVLAFRAWLLDETMRQRAGEPPTRYEGDL